MLNVTFVIFMTKVTQPDLLKIDLKLGKLLSILGGGYSPSVIEKVLKYHLRELIASEERTKRNKTC